MTITESPTNAWRQGTPGVEGWPGAKFFSSEARAWRSRSRASSSCPKSCSTVARLDCLVAIEGWPGSKFFSALCRALLSNV